MRRVTLGFAALRATAIAALVLLLWNPSVGRVVARDAAQRLVLLDASLSMAGHGARWREALDTARAWTRGSGIGGRGSGGVIWRFGERVTGFDTLPPGDGVTRLAPALAAAAARGDELIVVTDGAIADRADLLPDLVRRARVVVLPRTGFFDAFVAAVDGPKHVAARDTIRLNVSYGVAGMRAARCEMRDARCEMRDATLAVNAEGRRLTSSAVALPDSGVVSTELTFPASRIPHPGWAALEVRLDGVRDSEPRDDARLFVLEVNPQPAVVLLAAPPDWETRFLARALQDVARVTVRAFVQTEGGRSARWRDATTLEERTPDVVARTVAGARLVIEAGNPAAYAPFAPKGAAVLVWPDTRRLEGDWYVQAGGPSPLAAALAGLAWDSLPPLTSVADLPSASDSTSTVAVAARLARRGAPRPVVLLSERDGVRRAAIAGSGLYRWAFRGGASGEAYRALVAGLVDWLLEKGAGSGERFLPLTYEVPNGLPLVWRWAATGASREVVLTLAGQNRQRIDTLRFDATGRAELRLPPGAYRYGAVDGSEKGLVAVDTYSDEWRPAPVSLTAQPGEPGGWRATVPLRDRWWLFAVAIAAFAAEWAWRRRQGVP